MRAHRNHPCRHRLLAAIPQRINFAPRQAPDMPPQAGVYVQLAATAPPWPARRQPTKASPHRSTPERPVP